MDLPPAYNQDEADASPDKITTRPESFYAANRFIYGSSVNEPPIYELSHSLDSLNNSYIDITFQRLIPQVKKNEDGSPRVLTRSRDLYKIKHSAPGTFPTVPFHAEPVSRQAMCKLALESCRAKGHLFTKGFRICRAVRRTKSAADEKYANTLFTRRDGRGVTNGLSLGESIFTVAPSKQKGVVEWRDENNELVALQDNSEQLMRLNILAEMTLMRRDALMASWVLTLWFGMAAYRRDSMGWEEGTLQAAEHLPEIGKAGLARCYLVWLGAGLGPCSLATW